MVTIEDFDVKYETGEGMGSGDEVLSARSLGDPVGIHIYRHTFLVDRYREVALWAYNLGLEAGRNERIH
jgi:hypothetical protein